MPENSGIFHWNLPAGQYLSQPCLCENCNVTEDTDHYLFQCKKYKKEREQLENRVEEILNGTGLNEVADINLAVLVGMVENAHRETQNELIRALMEFIRTSQRFTKQ